MTLDLRAGITQRLTADSHGMPVDVLEHGYIAYFTTFFSSLVSISNHPDSLEQPDADVLILSGGGDLPNSVWGCPRLPPDADALARQRMDLQAAHVKRALERGRKVLAICYGMQLVNCWLGGRATWCVHRGAANRKPGAPHEIEVAASNGLGLEPGRVRVNGYHDHGVLCDQLHSDLVPLAVDDEYGVVEAAVHRCRRLLCLQWHPERHSPDPQFNRRLIEAFLESSG